MTVPRSLLALPPAFGFPFVVCIHLALLREPVGVPMVMNCPDSTFLFHLLLLVRIALIWVGDHDDFFLLPGMFFLGFRPLHVRMFVRALLDRQCDGRLVY